MSRLVWDQVGTRKFETGCDRGVLFLSNGTAVPWNGLTSCVETPTDVATEPYYLDGIKYLNRRTPSDYSGTLKALTYPDEFLEYDGVVAFDDGIFASDQMVSKTFGLSYRTKIGDDEKGLDLGYKLHLLYNLTAIPDAKTFNTLAGPATPEEFSWTLSGVPVAIPQMRPSVHITLDSTKIASNFMSAFENYLYGTDYSPGTLIDPATLIEIYGDVIEDLIDEPL